MVKGNSHSACVTWTLHSRGALTCTAACSGSYASWVAGDNLAPAGDGPAGSSALPNQDAARARRRVTGFAANGGAATLSVRKVAAALKVRPVFS